MVLYLIQTQADIKLTFPYWLQWIIAIAPILAFSAALTNLFLAIVVFKFTRGKNNSDRNIKWFQELIFSPNKMDLFAYFEALHLLKAKIPNNADLTEEQSIALIDYVKNEYQTIRIKFVDLIKPIDKTAYNSISQTLESLTDKLTEAIGNDELKWNNPKTIQKEVTQRIIEARNKVIVALFSYTG